MLVRSEVVYMRGNIQGIFLPQFSKFPVGGRLPFIVIKGFDTIFKDIKFNPHVIIHIAQRALDSRTAEVRKYSDYLLDCIQCFFYILSLVQLFSRPSCI